MNILFLLSYQSVFFAIFYLEVLLLVSLLLHSSGSISYLVTDSDSLSINQILRWLLVFYLLLKLESLTKILGISRNFRNFRQEDAHEYMVNLLESMHKCCLPSGVPSESPSAYEKSLVHKIFGGRLRSQVI